jgi:hypothetical protein
MVFHRLDSIVPRPAASAIAVPDMPAKITEPMMFTCASPPASRLPAQREIVDAVCDAGRIHQVSGKNEERHRKQWERVNAAGHPMQNDEIRQAGDEVGVDKR